MAFYARCMLEMSLELAVQDPVYEDMAIKFIQHFTVIQAAINNHDTGIQ